MAGPHPEHHITRPMALVRWEALTFLHWSYPPEAVQRLLPDDLRVDTWQGRAWVAITPFVMTRARLPGLPPVPGLSTFPETNVRTYVRDWTGRDGLWFLSLETTRVASLAARAVGLPYIWSRMSVRCRGDLVVYLTAGRRLPRGRDTFSRIGVRPGERIPPDELTDFEHFLTGRWRAFSRRAGRLFSTPVEHEPWPLHQAEAADLDFNIVAAAGLPAPSGAPVVHYAPRVDARLGVPRARSRRSSSRRR